VPHTSSRPPPSRAAGSRSGAIPDFLPPRSAIGWLLTREI